MCRRPLAGFFSRMCTGTPMASPNCPAAAQTRQCVWMSLLQEGLACCLCPVSSGHALRAVQPASESACSFLFLQPSVHSFCTPSVHLLYTFCTPSVHLLHILYISGRSTNPIFRDKSRWNLESSAGSASRRSPATCLRAATSGVDASLTFEMGSGALAGAVGAGGMDPPGTALDGAGWQ